MANFKPMLLLIVNNSIGNKNKHFSVKELIKLFNKEKKEFSNRDLYAIDVIQAEADTFEIDDFVEEYKISEEKKNYILSCNPYK